ncbi:hypothetical protein [Bradyrhizobium sp. Rc2d]|uniref:hypothetical protein n=1 Tax=Bradyrhizobium sp. Rc2d TaxID=1855321 RepID=UPI00115F9362|nr:hypothetical protein [Bradyrhizobium sp. Rc2d]
MRMIGYNYVKFMLKLRKRFHREDDGEFVSAAIYSAKEDEQELLVHDRRVGFVAGTAPDEKQKSLQVGDCMLMLGIPRVDLALVSWRIRHGGDALRWSMPSKSSRSECTMISLPSAATNSAKLPQLKSNVP